MSANRAFLKFSSYVRLILRSEGWLQVGSGGFCFLIKEDIDFFINFCSLLRDGICVDELDSILSSLGASGYTIDKVNELISERRFFDKENEYEGDFSRHLNYFNLSVNSHNPKEFQKNIQASSVLILGCGGIGSLMAMQLVAAGCYKICLVDHDIIEKSNLTRQFFYRDNDIGDKKVTVLKKALLQLRPSTSVEVSFTPVREPEDLYDIANEYDFIAVSADEPNNIAFIVSEYIRHTVSSAFLIVGYIQDLGVWGPIVSSKNADTFIKRRKEILGLNSDYISRVHSDLREKVDRFNKQYQAPSFGPLNQMVVGMAARDILFYLGGSDNYNSNVKRIGIYPDLTVEKQVFWE